MSDVDRFAELTCRTFLTATDLKELCRHRGFSPPGGDRKKLVEFLAPRLLEKTGVREAMASLDATGLVVLHTIARSESPVSLDDLRMRLRLENESRYWLEDRIASRRLVEKLLNRGIVLVRENHAPRKGGRFNRALFFLPDVHRPYLPPFPVSTVPLGSQAQSTAAIPFVLEALRTAVRQSGGARPQWPRGLPGRIASRFSFKDEAIRFAGAPVAGVSTLLDRVLAEWTALRTQGGRHRTGKDVFGWVAYILHHLPEGHACSAAALHQGLKLLDIDLPEPEIETFLDEGVQAGLVTRTRAATDRCYAGVPAREITAGDRPLAFTKDAVGIRIDLERTGLAALLDLAGVSRVVAAPSGLLLVPSIQLLGHHHSHLATLVDLPAVRERSAPWDRAVKHVLEHHGKTVLHKGLVVLRIEDLGLRTQVGHRLGSSARSLGGPYLVLPRALLARVEELVRKEGFSPRRVTDESAD
ncbi:MAG: hypothetical protein HY815_12910 [Candidatus Riflebacteria bacterium]|nr:hypothetical protein [Candidatus Riflebacteria bacterium]